MIDDPRLEARLRDDPTGDPRYVPGRFRDRVARAATLRAVGSPRALASAPLGALLVAVVLIALAIVVSPRQSVGPQATPTPTAPTPAGSFDPGAIQTALDAWAQANGGVPASAFLVDRIGGEYAFTTSAAGPLTSTLSVRIGELSRIYVASAAVALQECLIPGAPAGFACPTSPALEAFDLDDAVAGWLPEAGLDPAITVRSLLDGTSGLPAVGPTLADLTRRVAADPGADWSRATVLATALEQAPRFAPGSGREPVDTESMLLDDIIARVEGRAPGLWIEAVTSHAIGDQGQGSWTRSGTTTMVPGTSPAMQDLDPTVLAIVRDAAGMWATSDGLATRAWSSGEPRSATPSKDSRSSPTWTMAAPPRWRRSACARASGTSGSSSRARVMRSRGAPSRRTTSACVPGSA